MLQLPWPCTSIWETTFTTLKRALLQLTRIPHSGMAMHNHSLNIPKNERIQVYH